MRERKISGRLAADREKEFSADEHRMEDADHRRSFYAHLQFNLRSLRDTTSRG